MKCVCIHFCWNLRNVNQSNCLDSSSAYWYDTFQLVILIFWKPLRWLTTHDFAFKNLYILFLSLRNGIAPLDRFTIVRVLHVIIIDVSTTKWFDQSSGKLSEPKAPGSTYCAVACWAISHKHCSYSVFFEKKERNKTYSQT